MMAAVKFDPNVYYCVNALKGATSISTELEWTRIQADLMCQCPERGDLHFYFQDNITRIEASLQVCQCPERGDLHFY